MKYEVIIRCSDCMDDVFDEMGCNEGQPWSIGIFDTEKEAIKAGEEECKDVAPWYYNVKKP